MFTRKCAPRKDVVYTTVKVGPHYNKAQEELRIVSLIIDGKFKEARFVSSQLVGYKEIVEEWIREYSN